MGDGDLSALNYQHSTDQFTTSDLETLAHFPSELDCLNSTVEVESSLEDPLDSGGDGLDVDETVESVEIVTSVHHDCGDAQSPESILPEITEETCTDDMDIHEMGIPDSPEVESLQLSPNTHLNPVGHTVTFTAPMGSKTPQTAGSSIVVIQSPVVSGSECVTPTSFSQTHVTLSGGQIVGKIAGLASNVTLSSVPQFQSIGQTFVATKSSEGNLVQLRASATNRPILASSSSNYVSSALQGIKPLQATIKRPATVTSGQMKNVNT